MNCQSYRWGNPQNYRAGDEGDRVSFVAHRVNWIDPGFPGEGSLLIFNYDEGGREVASGTYPVRLRVNEAVEAERLVMLR